MKTPKFNFGDVVEPIDEGESFVINCINQEFTDEDETDFVFTYTGHSISVAYNEDELQHKVYTDKKKLFAYELNGEIRFMCKILPVELVERIGVTRVSDYDIEYKE